MLEFVRGVGFLGCHSAAARLLVSLEWVVVVVVVVVTSFLAILQSLTWENQTRYRVVRPHVLQILI